MFKNTKRNNENSSAISISNHKKVVITKKDVCKATPDNSGTKQAKSNMQSEGGGKEP